MTRTKLAAILSAAVIAVGGIAAACEPVDEGATPAADQTPAAGKKTQKKGGGESLAQQNARESAESYLQTGSFSRKSLIEQLEFEGFSTKDATYAVNAVRPNWNQQAAKSAKSYLDTGSFSRSSLLNQLRFEGFTAQQAEYGVTQAGY